MIFLDINIICHWGWCHTWTSFLVCSARPPVVTPYSYFNLVAEIGSISYFALWRSQGEGIHIQCVLPDAKNKKNPQVFENFGTHNCDKKGNKVVYNLGTISSSKSIEGIYHPLAPFHSTVLLMRSPSLFGWTWGDFQVAGCSELPS